MTTFRTAIAVGALIAGYALAFHMLAVIYPRPMAPREQTEQVDPYIPNAAALTLPIIIEV